MRMTDSKISKVCYTKRTAKLLEIISNQFRTSVIILVNYAFFIII